MFTWPTFLGRKENARNALENIPDFEFGLSPKAKRPQFTFYTVLFRYTIRRIGADNKCPLTMVESIRSPH